MSLVEKFSHSLYLSCLETNFECCLKSVLSGEVSEKKSGVFRGDFSFSKKSFMVELFWDIFFLYGNNDLSGHFIGIGTRIVGIFADFKFRSLGDRALAFRIS